MITVESAGITDVGRQRTGNEDALFVDDNMQLYVVADGMGGHLAGEVASRLVVETLKDAMKQDAAILMQKSAGEYDASFSEAANRLRLGILLANKVVYDASQNNSEYEGMGSTVSVVYLTQRTLIASNVGDSPIYRIRDGVIDPLYVSHTIMDEFKKIAPQGAKMPGDEYKHILTRAMGTKETVTPDLFEMTPSKGDIMVICSDGLSDLVSPEEFIEKVKDCSPDEACRALVALANERGGIDNITVIVLHINDVLPEETPAIEKEPDRVQQGVKKPRKKTKIAVDYDTESDSHRSFIDDINLDSVFIKTREAFTIGQKLMLTFSVLNEVNPFAVTGKIAERTNTGIRITFENLTSKQIDMIQSLIERI